MAKHYLIKEPSGEVHLVLDPENHSEDCQVLEEGVTPPRIAGCERVNGKWKIDKDVAREAALANVPHKELVRRILSFEERLKKLEGGE